MTSAASSPSPKSWIKIFALSAALLACSTAYDHESRHHAVNPFSSRFEWGVQHYEAGNYPKAITAFEALRKDGAKVPGYDLIDYYVGMSHFRLKQYDPAARELETFVRSGSKREEEQDARITLLLVYEQQARWNDIAGLAAESDKLTLFQNNRALLKLVWARALREQGELLGARAALDEAQPFLDKVGEDEAQPFFADPDQDLWGRFHFTNVLLNESDCALLHPKDIAPLPKNLKGKKALLKPRPKRLYGPWLEARVDCQRKAITEASEALFPLESPWTEPAVAALTQGNGALGEETRTYLKEEAPALNRFRMLQKITRENLYRLLGTIEEQMKDFKKRDLNEAPLESLRKQIDRLLVTISQPS